MTQQIASFTKKLLDLREGSEEKHTIIDNIKDDADFSSARLWTLVFAVGVASVGLNINSIPIIIGAMLISPLMGPIVSIGLALSIYDWGLMRRSFRNLAILTVISIAISAIYFTISPISNAHSELLARIQPTIFDVLVAIFGGMAGFIGISRARYNNVIPGVAIATALMPALCTVGYGIGTLQPKFIFGAFYLFLINCIFICLSSLVVATYLKLPKREYPDEAQKKNVKRIISAIIIIIVTPAVFLAYTFVSQNNFNQRADDFIKEVFENRGYVVIYKNIDYSTANKKIELAFLAARFSEEQIAEFEAHLSDFNLQGTEISIRQNNFALSEEEWQSVRSDLEGDDEKVKALEARLESERSLFESPERLLEEAKAINGKIENIAMGPLYFGNLTQDSLNYPRVVLVYTKNDNSLTKEEAELINNWLKTRLENDEIVTYFDPEPQAIVTEETDLYIPTETE